MEQACRLRCAVRLEEVEADQRISLKLPPLPTEQMVRGYKVRTVQQTVDPTEASARRQAIAEVLARSMKKP